MIFHRLKLQQGHTGMCPPSLMKCKVPSSCSPSKSAQVHPRGVCTRVCTSHLQAQGCPFITSFGSVSFEHPPPQAGSISHLLQASPRLGKRQKATSSLPPSYNSAPVALQGGAAYTSVWGTPAVAQLFCWDRGARDTHRLFLGLKGLAYQKFMS